MAKGGLGKGLGAFFPQTQIPKAEVSLPQENIVEIEIEKIQPNPRQPRVEFPEKELRELSASINEHGLIEPICVREKDEGFELIIGERRLRAVKLLGRKTIPAIIRKASDEESLILALVENLQRSDLGPIEEAKAYQTLISELKLTQEGVAEKVGKDRSTVANSLRLLKLSPEIQKLVVNQDISPGHARAILSLSVPADQHALCERILKERLTVRQAEHLANRWESEGGRAATIRKNTKSKPPEILEMEDKMRKSLGMQIKIYPRGQGGRIEVHYFSLTDLEKIFAKMTEK